MLGNLDNEIIFKKAFTNKIVFTRFVKDILGIEIEVDKIETEKRFEPKIGYIDFELDIFAESIDKRVVVEIQRVEYDHNFDRFLHYFLMTIAEQQKRAANYSIPQTVYVIVVLTAPYRVSERNGKLIKDEVLLMKLNPRTLDGKERDLYGHQITFLNPNYKDDETPQSIRDWLDLVYQSIHNPEKPQINVENEGIRIASDLINFDNLTPEERAFSKNKEAAKEAIAVYEKFAKAEGKAEGIEEGIEEGKLNEKIKIAENLISAGSTNEFISQITGLNNDRIDEIRNDVS